MYQYLSLYKSYITKDKQWLSIQGRIFFLSASWMIEIVCKSRVGGRKPSVDLPQWDLDYWFVSPHIYLKARKRKEEKGLKTATRTKSFTGCSWCTKAQANGVLGSGTWISLSSFVDVAFSLFKERKGAKTFVKVLQIKTPWDFHCVRLRTSYCLNCAFWLSKG